MDTFSIGDKVVYPTQGVGEVIGIEVREVSGHKKQFYILRIVDTAMTVLVPTDNTSSVGLREVIPKSEVSEIYGVLKQKKLEKVRQTWNRRHREYMDKLKTGCLYNVAEILRELSLLRSQKDLSFSERKMLETVRGLVVKEIAVAKHAQEAHIESEIDAIFA